MLQENMTLNNVFLMRCLGIEWQKTKGYLASRLMCVECEPDTDTNI